MYFSVLKQIQSQGTRESSEGIRTNYRWATVGRQIPWALNLAQAATGAFDFETSLL